MKSSSQESSSQPPCSPESPPWPPPTHWRATSMDAVRRGADRGLNNSSLREGLRPFLFPAERCLSFSLAREAPPARQGWWVISVPTTLDGGTGTFNALRWVPQRSGQPVLCSQVPTRSLLTDSLATPGVGPPRARGGHNLAPLRRCGTLWHMSPAHRFFRFFRFFRYPRGTPR